MDYKSIVVCLDSSARSTQRMNFAIDMAAQFDAHLTGLYLTHQIIYPVMPEAGFGPLIVQLEEELEASRKRAEHAFLDAARRAGIPFNWEAFRGHDFDLAAARARTADLVIVGQRDPDDSEAFNNEGFPELVVMGAGRPTLFLPYIGTRSEAFKRVLVAWNGSRESARALADALPLLTRADNVLVTTVESVAEERGPITVPGVDVASFLSRHGVKAEITRTAGIDISAGEWLLSQAADLGIDLLVAGAYGHGRVREFVLGGVTRTLLHEMTVPVLMSH